MIYNIALVLALLCAGFVFWKRGKEEHFAEDQLFDGFLLSVLGGLVIARCMYVILHFDTFGWTLVTWLNIFSHGGLSLSFGFIAAMFLLIRFSKKQNWEYFGILDMWVPGVVLAAGVVQFGIFLQFQLHPAILIAGVLLLAMSRYLYWLEYRYRTFAWYKSGQDVAKSGFITAVGLIFLGLIFLTDSFFPLGKSVALAEFVDRVLCLLGIVFGFGLLLNRSGVLAKNKKRQ